MRPSKQKSHTHKRGLKWETHNFQVLPAAPADYYRSISDQLQCFGSSSLASGASGGGRSKSATFCTTCRIPSLITKTKVLGAYNKLCITHADVVLRTRPHVLEAKQLYRERERVHAHPLEAIFLRAEVMFGSLTRANACMELCWWEDDDEDRR